MIPISRVEMYLAKICGEDVELPIPQTRKEVFLAIIAGESYEKPVPSSRVELYLAKILGDDVPLPIPQSREEIFLAKIAGVEYPLPYPESRIEYWLHKWATYEEWSTITGNPVSFTAKAAPLRKLEVAFSPVQEGTGDPSPDNVRPISGWDSLTVEQRGKNLFDAEHPEKNGYYNADGEYNSSTGYSCYLVPAKAEQKYTCQGNFAGIKTFWDKDLNFISGINQGGGATKTFTTPAGTAYFRISIVKTSIDGTQQIEFGETASEVVPYVTGRSISITLGSTVYSGTLDVVTGVGEITGVLDVFNVASGDGTSIEDSIGLFYLRNSGNVSTIGDYTRISFASVTAERAKYGMDSNKYAYKMCSMAKHLYSYNSDSNHWYVNTDFLLFLPTPLCGSTAQDAVNYLTSIKDTSPVEVWIPLATPIPIQLTPQEVESLAGDNTMFTPCDSLTVEYRSN